MAQSTDLFYESPVRGLLISELNEGAIDDSPEVADEEEDGSCRLETSTVSAH